MAKKDYSVTLKFPELPASRYYQCADVSATGLGRAADEAFKIIKDRPVVKGKRLTRVTIDVQLKKNISD